MGYGLEVEMVRKAHELDMLTCPYVFDPEQAKAMAALSDGAIVGSAIIKLLEQYGKDAPPYIGEYVREMKEALRETCSEI